MTEPAVPREPGNVAAAADEIEGALLLDVRRAAAFERADSLIPGARWCDPEQVSQWVGGLPAGAACVVYCVHGHEVSQGTAQRLREAGVDARYLQGGIEGWKAAGRPTVPKPAGFKP